MEAAEDIAGAMSAECMLSTVSTVLGVRCGTYFPYFPYFPHVPHVPHLQYLELEHPLAEGPSERLLMGTLKLLEHFDLIGRTERIALFAQRIYEALGYKVWRLPHAIEKKERPIDMLPSLHALNAVDMTVYQAFCTGKQPGLLRTDERTGLDPPVTL